MHCHSLQHLSSIQVLNSSSPSWSVSNLHNSRVYGSSEGFVGHRSQARRSMRRAAGFPVDPLPGRRNWRRSRLSPDIKAERSQSCLSDLSLVALISGDLGRNSLTKCSPHSQLCRLLRSGSSAASCWCHFSIPLSGIRNRRRGQDLSPFIPFGSFVSLAPSPTMLYSQFTNFSKALILHSASITKLCSWYADEIGKI